MQKNYYAIIMAGGVGSRFWPVSRTTFPKQFIDITGNGKSLIQATYERFQKVVPRENIYILTNQRYSDLVKEQLEGITDDQILCEPAMRNTAPCINYACHKIHALNPEASLVIAPSDALILDTDRFAENVLNGLDFAASNPVLVTLGIQPSRPDTGYGYIRFEKPVQGEGFHKVKQFTEKPQLEKAKEFVASGEYLWNAGIFIWKTETALRAFEAFLPDMNKLFADGRPFLNTADERRFIDENYPSCENISIDYGVMERADNVFVLPVDFGWSDLGTWASLYDLAPKDEAQNVVVQKGNELLYNTEGCMINLPSGKKVIIKGLKDFIIAESNDTLMIVPRNAEQEVKQVVADVKEKFGTDFI